MQLTRRRIIAAAIEAIERDGIEAVSMSRLATELGCGLMPLYHHVPSRSALLDGVAAAVLAGLPAPPAPGPAGWAAQLRAQARAFWLTARARPRSAMAAVPGPARPGVIRPAETALATLQAAGFSAQEAVRIARAFAAYILGSLLCEFGAAPGLLGNDDGSEPRLRAADFPAIASVLPELRARDPDTDFDFGLDLLVRGLTALPTREC